MVFMQHWIIISMYSSLPFVVTWNKGLMMPNRVAMWEISFKCLWFWRKSLFYDCTSEVIMNLILSSQMKHLMTVACGKTRHKFIGIYNGLDEAVWDPAHDPALPATYSFEHLSGKSICKGILRQELGLPLVDESVPLVSVQDFYWTTGLLLKDW